MRALDGLLVGVVSRLARYLDILETLKAELPVRWREPGFRRQVAIGGGLWLLVVLLFYVPFSGGRPLLDAPTAATQAGSHILDAAGVVHYLRKDRLTLVWPGVSDDLAGVSGIGLMTAIMILGCLGWAAITLPSDRLFAAVAAGSIVAALITNVASLALMMLLGGVTGISIATGGGWALTVAVRLAVTLGMFVSCVAALETGIARWKAWKAIRFADETRELPPPVTITHRGPQAMTAGWLVCMLVMWLSGRVVTKETLITSYRDVAHRSLGDNDEVAASVAVERLLQLDPRAAPHRFLQAQMYERAGDLDRAEAIIREIADSRGRQYEPAHRWLASRIAGQREHMADETSAGSKNSVSRLKTATQFDPSNINAHIALAETYIARRSPQQALRELEQVVDQRPDLRLTLARLAILAGKPDTARLHGDLARSHYRDQVKSLPLSLEARMRLAASHLFLEQFSEAVTVLLKGWELTQDESYHHGLGVTYLVWHHSAARSGADKSEQLSLLEKSLKYAPDSPETLRRLATLATEEGQTGPAIDLLTCSLANRPIPPSVHLILGTNAFRQGRAANALRHLEEAHRLDPENVETLNNLAWVLAETDPLALDRALELADEAVCRDPNRASLRETRGQILAKLSRWPQAIADLENAMQVMQDNPAIHTTLAQAYGELGDLRLADEHRQRAETLTR